MKTLLKIFAVSVVSLLAAACSNGGGESVIDAIGDNATSAIVLNPKAIATSANVKSADDLSRLLPAGRNMSNLRIYLSLKGIDMDRWASAQYGDGEKNIDIFAIRDRSDLEKSLKQLDYKKGKTGNYEVWSPADAQKAASSLYFVNDGDYLWGLTIGAAGQAATKIKEIKDDCEHLADWKRKALESDAAVRGFVNIADTYLTMTMKLAGPDCVIEANCVDANGGEARWPFANDKTLNANDAEGLYSDCLATVAIAPADYAAALTLLSKAGFHELSTADISAIGMALEGPVMASVDIQFPFDDFANARFSTRFTTRNDLISKGIVATANSNIAAMGYNASFKSEGKVVYGFSDKAPGTQPVSGSEIEDCIAWIKVKLPPDALNLLTDSDICGIECKIALRPSTFVMNVSLTDTDEPFLANFLKFLN